MFLTIVFIVMLTMILSVFVLVLLQRCHLALVKMTKQKKPVLLRIERFTVSREKLKSAEAVVILEFLFVDSLSYFGFVQFKTTYNALISTPACEIEQLWSLYSKSSSTFF